MTDQGLWNIFYSLNDAQSFDTGTPNPFIITYEVTYGEKSSRQFIVFPTFEIFLENRKTFPFAHENLGNHKMVEEDRTGRFMVDFDIDDESTVPDNFKELIEEFIMKFLKKFCNKSNFDIELIEFVWMHTKKDRNSKGIKKMSKHLILKNFCLLEWAKMTKKIYNVMQKFWDNNPKYEWIAFSDLFDLGITRKNSNMRMVGSKKIGGHSLKLDSKEFTLTDSLIRLYRQEDIDKEQFIGEDCFIDGFFKEKDPVTKLRMKSAIKKEATFNSNIPKIIANRAFALINKRQSGVFSQGNLKGPYLQLIRNKSADCIVCKKYYSKEKRYCHETENAFLIISEYNQKYYVKYACWRQKNTHDKLISENIGIID